MDIFGHLESDCDTVETEIAPGVVLVTEARPSCGDFEETGDQGQHLGLIIDLDTAKKILSQNAIQSANSQDDRLYYSAPYRYMIPLYELLENHYITNYDIIRYHDTLEISEDGQYHCPDYFGELERAVESRDVKLSGYKHVSNGVDAFLYVDGSVEIAVHEVAASYDLSDAAQAFGFSYGSHLHYLNDTCAIPLRELTAVYPELMVWVNDEAGMKELLAKSFPAYTLLVEKQMEEEVHA